MYLYAEFLNSYTFKISLLLKIYYLYIIFPQFIFVVHVLCIWKTFHCLGYLVINNVDFIAYVSRIL